VNDEGTPRDLVEMMDVDQYLPILGLLILGVLFASGSFVASGLLAPHKRPTDAKLAPYECGIVPEIEPPQRFPVRFYLVAMIFVPFAVVFRQLRGFGLIEVLVFSLAVFAALLFLVAEGALTWGPVKHLVPGMPSRTSSSTIVRIGADEKEVA
jgi:NADH-quinone oxidoreductase subunit A